MISDGHVNSGRRRCQRDSGGTHWGLEVVVAGLGRADGRVKDPHLLEALRESRPGQEKQAALGFFPLFPLLFLCFYSSFCCWLFLLAYNL